MLRGARLVPATAIFLLAVSLAIHITAYIRLLPPEVFLLYCRAEWIGVGFVAFLYGRLMPSPTPRRQLLALLRWMSVACLALFIYLVYVTIVYSSTEHPRRQMVTYYMVKRGAVTRRISEEEYQVRSAEESRFYFMNVNRAFSLVGVIMFLGMASCGLGYLKEMRRRGISGVSHEKFVPWWYAGG